ncbi:hypothetical protein LSAT2_025763, partial [Lamellibrachia satsuma]
MTPDDRSMTDDNASRSVLIKPHRGAQTVNRSTRSSGLKVPPIRLVQRDRQWRCTDCRDI